MKNLENQNKSYGDEATDFHDKEIPKMDFNHTCLAVIGWILVSIKMETVIWKYF